VTVARKHPTKFWRHVANHDAADGRVGLPPFLLDFWRVG
jgi:hypothetical protein